MRGESASSSITVAGVRVNWARHTPIRRPSVRRDKKKRLNEGAVQGEILDLTLTDLLRTVMDGQPCICLGRLTQSHKQNL